MDDVDRLLSIKLYDVMDQVGVSERIRTLYQESAITEEIIKTISNQIRQKGITNYIFGSSCEGTTTNGLNSDVDIVHCKDDPVIDDIHDAPRGQSYLMVREDHTYPGYVKLQLVYDGTPNTIYNSQINCHLHFITDTKGRICKKHYTQIDLNDHRLERHGPADAFSGCEHAKPHHHVLALRCRTMPICARTWIHRRRYNWPSRGVLQKMGDYGSFVVGVGHSSSIEPHTEWRLSFSLQERLLMFNLNPTQHKCYVLLKIIKKELIKAEVGECISSYHCKTCLFHAIKVTHAAIWRQDNLVGCVRLCLRILLTWVVNGVCPNYFIPSENMFEKPQFRANKFRLLELLRAVIADDISIILRLQCDDISNRLLQPGIIYSNMTETIVYHKYMNMYKSINQFSFDMYKEANYSQSIHQNVLTLSHHIERLTITRVIGEHTEQQTKDAISYVVPVLHFHIAQRLASFACKVQCQDHARRLLYLSIHHFRHGNRADLMTSRLLQVSLFFRLEKYDLCEIILDDIAHDFKRHLVTKCNCVTQPHVNNAELLKYLSTNNVSCKTAMRTVFVGCVRFARWDIDMAPEPLQYQMDQYVNTPPRSWYERDKRFDCAAIDGNIYLYFLQYLVYSRLNKPVNKQIAIRNIVSGVINNFNLRHNVTALNLLCWIHVQEGRIPEASRCLGWSKWLYKTDVSCQGDFVKWLQDMLRNIRTFCNEI